MHLRPVAMLLGGALLLTACTQVAGSGTTRTESRDVSGFTAVELAGSGDVTISQTGAESLTIEAEDNVLPVLTSEVSGNTLRLGQKHNTHVVATRPTTYRLTVKDLDNVSVSGSGSLTATKITTGRLGVELSGSGTIAIDGSADASWIDISGSGVYTAGDLTSKNVNATISGGGAAHVTATNELDATISGSGTLTYGGNPSVSEHVSGSGEVTRR